MLQSKLVWLNLYHYHILSIIKNILGRLLCGYVNNIRNGLKTLYSHQVTCLQATPELY